MKQLGPLTPSLIETMALNPRFDGVKFPDARRTTDTIASRFSRKLNKRGMHFLRVRRLLKWLVELLLLSLVCLLHP
jgi:hypothetical protein